MGNHDTTAHAFLILLRARGCPTSTDDLVTAMREEGAKLFLSKKYAIEVLDYMIPLMGRVKVDQQAEDSKNDVLGHPLSYSTDLQAGYLAAIELYDDLRLGNISDEKWQGMLSEPEPVAA